MRTSLLALSTTSLCIANMIVAAKVMAEAPSAVPATRSVAAIAPSDVALHQYFYIDFPRQLQSLQNEIQLAEAELDLIARRVDSYRPFRSFGRYAATYTVDHAWQVALLAAQHRLECLRNQQADLWRERRLLAEAWITP